jgi:hypothetical protein
MTAPATELDAELARLGVTGALRTAPLGTTLPVGLTAYTTPFVNLGYISDDGITESQSEDRQEFTPWQSASPIRTEVTKGVTTFHATLWESNWDTISLYYRVGLADATVGTGPDAGVVTIDQKGKPKQDLRVFAVDVVDGVYARRMLVPMGEVTERGDIVYKSDTLIGYEVTITAYEGPDGISVRRIFKEGWAPPVAP